jgi:hypothetical protein
MLDRIVEVFCEVDDFCQAFLPHWEASLLGPGGPAPRGPEPGLSPSEIITLLLTVQASNISRAHLVRNPGMVPSETICGVRRFHRVVFQRCVRCPPVLHESFKKLE